MKNKKLVTLVSTGVLAVGLVGGGIYVAHAKNVEAETVRKQKESDKELETTMDKYLTKVYTDNTYTDVKDNVTQEMLDKIAVFTKKIASNDMKKITKSKLNELEIAPKLVAIKNSISTLFESEDVAKTTINEKKFEQISNEIKDVKDKKEAFSKKETERLNLAKISFEEAKSVETEVNNLFDGESVKEGVTRESYQSALDQVARLKQVTLQEQLISKLKVVDAKITEKEQVVVAEEQAKVAANAQSGSTGDGSSNAGYTDNSSSNSTPPAGGSQGNNSNSEATQQPSAPPAPVQPSNPSPGTSWNGTSDGSGGIINGQNNDNGSGTHNTWEGGDWDYN